MIIKNSNLRIMLYQNRYKILGIIVSIILILAMIKVMNTFAKMKLEEQKNNTSGTTVESVYRPEETMISGENVPKEEQIQNDSIIDLFMQACNEKKIEEAYNMLTDECKEQVFFNSIQKFKDNYVERVFKSKKEYNIQSWIAGINYTYKVRILNNFLETGNVSSIENAIEDYYTIVKQDNGYKLNINGYIGRQKINQVAQQENVKIILESKDVFKEYETYNFKIENHTENTICIDSKEKVDTMYLVGENERNYTAYAYELDTTRLVVNSKNIKNVTIKYNKIYSNRSRMSKIVFEDIVLNYEEYKQITAKQSYTNRIKIEIDL